MALVKVVGQQNALQVYFALHFPPEYHLGTFQLFVEWQYCLPRVHGYMFYHGLSKFAYVHNEVTDIVVDGQPFLHSDFERY